MPIVIGIHSFTIELIGGRTGGKAQRAQVRVRLVGCRNESLLLGGIHCCSLRMVCPKKGPKLPKTASKLKQAHHSAHLLGAADGCRLNAVGLSKGLPMRSKSFSAADRLQNYPHEIFWRAISNSHRNRNTSKVHKHKSPKP
jgi:hypothetical protein